LNILQEVHLCLEEIEPDRPGALDVVWAEVRVVVAGWVATGREPGLVGSVSAPAAGHI